MLFFNVNKNNKLTYSMTERKVMVQHTLQGNHSYTIKALKSDDTDTEAYAMLKQRPIKCITHRSRRRLALTTWSSSRQDEPSLSRHLL